MNISTSFNVGDLTPYTKDEDEGNEDLRANSIQGGRLMQSKLNNPTSSVTSKPWCALGL